MKEILKKWWFWLIIVAILILILPIFPCSGLTYGADGNPSGTAVIAYKNLINIFFLDGCPV